MTVRYDLLADELFFHAAFERHLQLKLWRRGLFTIRIFASIMLAWASFICFANDDLQLGTICLAFVAFMLTSRRIDDWRRMRIVKRSPEFGDRFSIELNSDGVSAAGEKSDFNCKWSAITEAVEYPDGLLLYQGANYFRWLPHTALADRSSPEEAVALVRDTGVTYRQAK